MPLVHPQTFDCKQVVSDMAKYFLIYRINNGIPANTLRFNQISAIKINSFLHLVCHHVYHVYDVIITLCVDADC